MIKIKTTIVPQEVEEIVDIICNVCGKSMIGKTCRNTVGLVVRISGCYDSTHLPDDESHLEFAICEECLVEKIFPSFKIPPERVER